MHFDDYVAHDGLGLAALVQRGELRATELLDLALQRLKAVNPQLNAVVRRRDDAARREAEAIDAARAAGRLQGMPFAGVPFLVKDLLATLAGEPTGCGTARLQQLAMPADSTLVQRFRAAGLVIAGRSNTPELGLTPYTEPRVHGPARNPWRLTHMPGGSSGGSAAAVAAGIVPLASGGDGGGSIRIPASSCGLFGFKPSRGATPTGPSLGLLWSGLAIEHVLTRSVRDSAAALDATAAPEAGAPHAGPHWASGPPASTLLEAVARPPGRLRIALCTQPLLGRNVQPACVAAAQDAAALLTALGHQVDEAVPPVDRAAVEQAFVTLIAAEAAADLQWIGQATGAPVRPAEVEPATAALALIGRSTPAAELAAAQRLLQGVARGLVGFFTQHDVLLTPTLGSPPQPIGAQQPSAAEQRLLRAVTALGAGWLLRLPAAIQPLLDKTFDTIPFTALFNITGQPAMSVPLHWSADGLPVGVQLAGRFGEDALLFSLAGQLEQARPWFHRRPPLAA